MLTRTIVVGLVCVALIVGAHAVGFKRSAASPVVEDACTITLDLNDLPPEATPVLPGELYDAVRI